MSAASLRDTLSLVAGRLPAAVVAPVEARRLTELSRHLPSSLFAGFEVRLDGDATVDVQQGFNRATGGPAALARVAAGRDGEAWRRLARLAATWEDAALPVRELWLEWDVDADGPGDQPSAFAWFDAAADDGARTAVLDLLLGGAGDEVRATFRRAVAAAEGHGGVVSHVGATLGRPLQVARAHLSGVPVRAWEAVLPELGWPGDARAARDEAERLLLFADHAVLCLDVAGAVGPRLGIETYLRDPVGYDLRWSRQLRALAQRGLCTPEKAASLPGWPGAASPADGEWPAWMIARDLVRPASDFGRLERRMSHVKLVLDGEARSAKAYFGWGHVHRSPTQRHGAAAEDAVSPTRRRDGDVAAARARAAGALVARRSQLGLWVDFRSGIHHADRVLHECDEWTTGFTGAALARCPEPAARDAAADALGVLWRRPHRGGYGYNRVFPVDGDSTAWVLQLAEGVDATSEVTSALRAWTEDHVEAGGVQTFCDGTHADLERTFRVPAEDFVGWRGPHVCVTAAVAASLGPATRAALLADQEADGRWRSYWWPDDTYATGFACWSLSAAGDPEAVDAVRRGGRWLAGRVGADGAVRDQDGGSAFWTALALLGLAAATRAGVHEVADARDRATGWLLGAQRPDGAFPPAAKLLITHPSAFTPVGPGDVLNVYRDDGLFTTATALWALLAVEGLA